MLKFRFDRRIIRVLKPSNLLGDGRNAKKGGRREAKVREAGGSDPPVPPPPPPTTIQYWGIFVWCMQKQTYPTPNPIDVSLRKAWDQAKVNFRTRSSLEPLDS